MVQLRELNPKRWKALASLPKRMGVLRQVLARSIAEGVLADVRAKLASAQGDDNYGEALKLQAARGARGSTELAITLRAKAGAVAALPVDKVVVYIRRKAHAKPDAVLDILVRFSPWPLDTLPVVPASKAATIYHRRVTRDEVNRVRQQRRDDSSVWRVALQRAGARVEPMVLDPATPVVPDMLFQALRLEFGSRDRTGMPVWRPALKTIDARLRRLSRGKRLREILYGSPAKVKQALTRLPKADRAVLKGSQPFMDRILAAV